jgi:2-polyprenyl-6-methoxyphenol hydroxylase-like FAD-dependent oxidoreductase
MASAYDVPVLIIGGGPVGMALGTELGYQGIETLVVERRDGTVSHPKMNMISTRTMEFCRRWGVAEEIRGAGWPPEHPMNIAYVTSLSGYRISGFEYPSYNDRPPWQHTPEGHQRCSQLFFDPVIQRRAESFGCVSTRYRTLFKSFEQDDDGVTATVEDRDTGKQETIRAQYMVACDGADSPIRQNLGINIEGDAPLSFDINMFFESQDVMRFHREHEAMMYWLYGTEGFWAQFIAVDGRGLWRLSMITPELITDTENFDSDKYIRRALGSDDIDYELKSILPWERHRRVADAYHKGRIFLAGDAVHQYSPTGGLGMNTGIQEAVDIAWKLAAVLNGWGGDQLLDSYFADRQSVAIRNNEEATANFKKLVDLPSGAAIDQDSEAGDALRASAQHVIETGGYNEEYEQEGITVGYRYDTSPICIDDGSGFPALTIVEYEQSARPGARAPHIWLGNGRSTLDLFGPGFTLLRLGPDAPDAPALTGAAATCGMPFNVEHVEHVEVDDAAGIYNCTLCLVRPDGHVAWRGNADPENATAIINAVRGAGASGLHTNADAFAKTGRAAA